MRMRTGSAGLALILLSATPVIAHAQLWKNGDFDGFDGLSSERNTSITDSRVYDNFVATGSGWFVTSLLGNYLTNFTATTAYWEIRSGVANGFAGLTVHSGTSAITGVTDLGDFSSFLGLLDHYRYQVSGFTPFLLPAGEYWLTIAPIGSGTGRAFVATTSGSGSINAVSDQTAFWASGDFGVNFVPVFFGTERVPSDFAYGIEGSSSLDTVVPEPSTFILLGTGLGLMALARMRRRS